MLRISCIFLLLATTQVLADDTAVISRKCTLTKPTTGAMQYVASVDLGEVPAGTISKISVEVENRAEIAFDVGRFRSSYSCLSPSGEMRPFTFANGATKAVGLSLNAPSRADDVAQQTVFEMGGVEPGSPSFRIAVHYKLAGLLCFERPVFYAEVGEEEAKQGLKLRIPFRCSKPVTHKTLTASCTGNLKHLDCTVTDDVVEIDVPNVDEASGLPGELVVEDTVNHSTAKIRLYISLKPPFEFAPAKLRFQWREEKDAYGASFICRAAENGKLQDKEKAESRLTIETWLVDIAGFELQQTERKLSSSISRVQFWLRPTNALPTPGERVTGKIGVQFRYGKERLRKELDFVLTP